MRRGPRTEEDGTANHIFTSTHTQFHRVNHPRELLARVPGPCREEPNVALKLHLVLPLSHNPVPAHTHTHTPCTLRTEKLPKLLEHALGVRVIDPSSTVQQVVVLRHAVRIHVRPTPVRIPRPHLRSPPPPGAPSFHVNTTHNANTTVTVRTRTHLLPCHSAFRPLSGLVHEPCLPLIEPSMGYSGRHLAIRGSTVQCHMFRDASQHSNVPHMW